MVWVANVTGDCINPPKLENGVWFHRTAQTSIQVGDRVIYKCNPGYIGKGPSRSIQCKDNSTWSPLLILCEPQSCGNPGEILNGYYRGTSSTLGSKVTFYCEKGYRLVGRTYRMCTANGWDGQIPRCEPGTCDDLPPILNGETPKPPNNEHWEIGMVAIFSCRGEYSLIGASDLVCTETGKWDKNPPTCKVVKCHPPPTIRNGHIVTGWRPPFKYQKGVTYACSEGYIMVGSKTIECRENNKYIPSPPRCIKSVDCQQPRTIANGNIVSAPRSTYKYRDRVTYSCNRGYVMVGNSIIECNENGRFDPEPPTCKLSIRCENLLAIHNGITPRPPYGGYWKYGMVATYSCNSGYSLIGADKLACTETGKWDNFPPTCKAIRCENLLAILNGITPRPPFGGYWKYGMVATYSCNSGYSLIGADKLVCTESGKWDNFPPTCKAIRCENLLAILNGITPRPPYGGYWKYGMVATFSCNSGYSLIGADKLTCTESGKWDNFPPTCKVTPCGNPGEIPNGYYKAPNKTVGNKVTFYCDIGYKMVGKDYRQCTAEGWDGEVPSCEPITCNDPEKIPHGYYRTPNKAFGDRVTYYCDIGYKIVDRDYRQCTSEGWKGDVPSCEPITCGNPGEIQNGYYSAPNKTIGSKVTFYCDIGYTMLGRDYRKCTFEGWDGEVPSCEPINCGVPAKILNGYYEVANKTFGRIVTFYCNVGYKIVGKDYQQCTAEGWVGDAPSCESINCGDPGSILNGYYKAPKWTVGSNVTFYCDIGYKIIGRDYRQCTAEGWDGEIPSCEPITCGHPGEILNGHYKTLNETVAKKVTVYCNFGYKLVGRAYRQCTAEGWDGDDPSCEPINCGDPGSIPNGYYKVSNWKVGSNVTFYCDIGYKIIGRDYRQCTAEGWDGEIPSCEPITCGHPGEIPNGQYKALNETVPNKVIFYCDTGYKVVGRAYRHCTAEGWDGDGPSCEPINCGNPGSLPNGYYKALNWTIGSHVTFYCDIGYKLIGRDYRQCTAEGWDGEVPLCEPITCGHPGKILHGHYKALNETVPNKVIFHCEFGFKMLGRAYRQCTADGWDGDVPTCEPINCGNPGSILHGYYKASKWTVGSNVTFYCDIGYKIIGRDYHQCTVDGWDGEVPSCEPITCDNPGEILNGHYMTPNETDGNKVFYYCDFG
ncbi:hypothetical protein chiPu_0019620 [Chiloscyllium punctatum]|uniref:Sushi domain-containing protein n=1 Tax=Chiloscyllium punctatum TaxID=137246 RepID=A0A401RSM8_CHIPU|nr:hypothetical protein [Chiloscyllium punctatum]